MDLTRVGICGGSARGQSALRALLARGDFYHAAVADCGCHDNRMDKIWWNESLMGWPLGAHYEESVRQPATFAPEVAVIVDERSPLAIGCNRTIMYAQSYVIRNRLYRMGAPIRVHYLGDLLSGRVPPAKVYLFLNPFYVDRAGRDAIARATAGKTAVYFYGSGFLADTFGCSNWS